MTCYKCLYFVGLLDDTLTASTAQEIRYILASVPWNLNEFDDLCHRKWVNYACEGS